MRLTAIFFGMLASLLAVSGAYGQAIQQPRKVNAFGDKEAGDSLDLYNILHDNAPGDFPGSAVPYATLVGKDGRFIFGAGGFVKAVAGWDFGHPIPSADEFITSQIPMGPMDGDGSRFNLSARQTHLYINFVVLPGTENQIGAFVGANFLTDGYSPVLTYAFLRYRGLKAGYDNTLFSDPACAAPSVDYEGPPSNTCNPVAGISYTWQRGRWMAGGGIELPQPSFTTVAGRTRQVYQRVPDIPVAAKYSWGEGNSWVRLSAILRTLTYRDEMTHRNHNKPGYGLQLSGAEYFLDRLTFYWQGVWGKGIGSMMQDTADEGLDMTPIGNGDTLSPVMAWGGFLALRYDISSRFSASATYSQLRTYAKKFDTFGTLGGNPGEFLETDTTDESITSWGSLYKYAQYFSANAFFSATSYFEIGLEYIWGRRTDYSGARAADHRLQASLQLTF